MQRHVRNRVTWTFAEHDATFAAIACGKAGAALRDNAVVQGVRFHDPIAVLRPAPVGGQSAAGLTAGPPLGA